MRAEALATVLLLAALALAAYSLAVALPHLSQIGGTGTVEVPKTSVRVLRVLVTSPAISAVTVSIATTVSGSYRVEAYVRVGACSASGYTTATLGPTPASVTISVSPSCTFNGPVLVTVMVYQA